MDENKIVLCGANAYEKKYYFNEEQFKMIPDSIKQELHVICVLFTEEVGGVFTIAFEEDGNVVMETNADDDDIYYDEISSGLLISEIRRNRQCRSRKRQPAAPEPGAAGGRYATAAGSG